MKSYSEIRVFHPEHVKLWRKATELFDQLPRQESAVFSHPRPKDVAPPYRCHEVARAVAELLNLSEDVQDGWYGHVEHTWIWLRPPGGRSSDHVPHGLAILDVYAVGRLPAVQLVACDLAVHHYSAGGGAPSLYRESPPRRDIRTDVVRLLTEHLAAQEAGMLQRPLVGVELAVDEIRQSVFQMRTAVHSLNQDTTVALPDSRVDRIGRALDRLDGLVRTLMGAPS